MPKQPISVAILENSPDPISLKDLEGRFVLVNSACASLLGKPSEEVIGMRDAEILGDQRAASVMVSDSRVMATGISEVVEESFVEGGELRVFLSTKSPWRNSEGEIVGLIGVARDITERKRAEQALKDSQARLQLALNAGHLGTWDFDMRTNRLDWSDNHYRLFGIEPGEFTPTSELFTSRIHPDDRSRVEQVIADAVASGNDFSVQYRVTWANSTVHWLEARGQVVTENGRAVGTVGAVADVTDRKQLEGKRIEAAKFESLGVLAGGIAHDFNNLLACILGNACLICDEAPEGSAILDMANSIVDASERAAKLTKQMLAYSGRGHFMGESINVSTEVATIVELLDAGIPGNVEIEMNLATALPPLHADRGQIHQVIMNLIVNAVEALVESTGRVTVETGMLVDNATRFAYLKVHDNGPGISDEVKEQVFDPFFTTKFPGRGLGLAAVHGIVRAHNGRVQVTSDEARGTTFSVLLPFADS